MSHGKGRFPPPVILKVDNNRVPEELNVMTNVTAHKSVVCNLNYQTRDHAPNACLFRSFHWLTFSVIEGNLKSPYGESLLSFEQEMNFGDNKLT